MKTYFKQRGILKCSPSNGDVKCAVVERFIRTLKQRLYRYFNQNNSKMDGRSVRDCRRNESLAVSSDRNAPC